jgi:hypothetical protein
MVRQEVAESDTWHTSHLYHKQARQRTCRNCQKRLSAKNLKEWGGRHPTDGRIPSDGPKMVPPADKKDSEGPGEKKKQKN